MKFLVAIIFLFIQCLTFGEGKKCAFYNKRWSKNMRWCGHSGSNLYIGDLNGDRRADMLCQYKNSGIASARIDGTFSSKQHRWCHHRTEQLLLGDFNGDGRQDLLCHDITNGYKRIKFADKYGRYNGVIWEKAMGWCYHKTAILFVGDFNGDYRSDLLCHDTKSGYKWIALADADGHFHSTSWHKGMGWCSHGGSRLLIGDFNGDCRSDLMCHDTRGSTWIALAKSAPHLGFTGTTWSKTNFWCFSHRQLFLGDFNGDKRTDMMCHDGKNGYKWIAYNHGPSRYFIGTSWKKGLGWCYNAGAKLFVGDFNADNRDDILCHDKQGHKWIIYNECK